MEFRVIDFGLMQNKIFSESGTSKENKKIDTVAQKRIFSTLKKFREIQFRVIDFGLVQKSITRNTLSRNLNSAVPRNFGVPRY